MLSVGVPRCSSRGSPSAVRCWSSVGEASEKCVRGTKTGVRTAALVPARRFCSILVGAEGLIATSSAQNPAVAASPRGRPTHLPPDGYRHAHQPSEALRSPQSPSTRPRCAGGGRSLVPAWEEARRHAVVLHRSTGAPREVCPLMPSSARRRSRTFLSSAASRRTSGAKPGGPHPLHSRQGVAAAATG